MIYFDNSCTSFPKAPGVSDAMKRMLDEGGFNINRGEYARAYSLASVIYDTREAVAELFDFHKGKNVVFTSGITQSINMALKGLLVSGDHVVTTSMEHNAVIRPLTQMKKRGILVTVLQADINGRVEPEAVEAALRPRTRMVVMTHASNVCGTYMPIRQVGEICMRRGVLFLVDTAQTAGSTPISMTDDSISLLTFTGHKGLLGPQGIGGLILTDEAAEQIVPLISGGTGSYSHLNMMPEQMPDKLEAGTMNLPGIVGLASAIAFLAETGVEAIGNRTKQLCDYAARQISGIDGVRLAGEQDMSKKTSVLTIDIPEMDTGLIAGRLDSEYGIMTRCGLHCAPLAHKSIGTYPQGAIRCSFGYWNSKEEIDNFAEAMDTLIREERSNGIKTIRGLYTGG